ncbi:hypothetical protein ABPG74_019739 [Tetrahymena malaccensis]
MEQQVKEELNIDLKMTQNVSLNSVNDGSCSNSASQVYITFEDLPQNSQFVYELIDEVNEQNKQKVFDIKGELGNSNNWKAQFTAIDQLRALNKFRSEDFITKVFPKTFDFVIALIDSIRSNLSKNALLLVKEIFLVNKLSALEPEAVPIILRKLFDKAISDKMFLKQEAKNAILQMEKNDEALFDCNLGGLSELCFDKNASICELACQSLHNIIIQNKHNIDKLSVDAYNNLIATLSKCLEGKRALLKKLAKEMCQAIHQQKGDNAFSSLSQPEQQQIIQAISQPKNDSKPSFRDFLAQKKKDQI